MIDQLIPARRRMDVHFDHARIRRHLEQLQTLIARRRIAFDDDLHAQFGSARFDGGQQVQIVVELGQRRHEDVQHLMAAAEGVGLHFRTSRAGRVARFDTQCGAGDPACRFAASGDAQRGVVGVCNLRANTCAFARAAKTAAGCAQRHCTASATRATCALAIRCVRVCARTTTADTARPTRAAFILHAQLRRAAQRRRRCERIMRVLVRIVRLRYPRQRIERQTVAHRRIAWDQIHAIAAEIPRPGDPTRPLQRQITFARQRQHIARHRRQPAVVHAPQTHALHLVIETRFERIDVHRQAPLAPQVVPGVLIARFDELRIERELARQVGQETPCILGGIAAWLALVGEQRVVVPARLAIGTPVERQRPARQLLARVPLALADVQEAVRAIARAQLVHQPDCIAALGRPERVGVPLIGVAVAHGDEGRLAAHRQAHVHGLQFAVHVRAHLQHIGPHFLGVRLGDARGFQHALD